MYAMKVIMSVMCENGGEENTNSVMKKKAMISIENISDTIVKRGNGEKKKRKISIKAAKA